MPRRPPAGHEVRVTASAEAERAIEDYLASLGRPGARARTARPKPDFARATKGIDDPLARLAAIKAERERVATLAAVETAEAAFVRYAKTWARIHGYDREDFAVLGVPKRVLAAAFGSPPAEATARVRKRRAPRTEAKTLAAAIEAKPPGSWVSIAGIVDEVGGSPETVRKVLGRLSAEGTLTHPIDDPNHAGRGRAAKVWQRN